MLFNFLFSFNQQYLTINYQNFVTERKIDEELARTTRFVGDKDQLLSTIGNFGEGKNKKNIPHLQLVSVN